VIRAARPEDVGAVLGLWGAARSAHAVIADGALLVAVEDGEVVGAVIAAFDGWRGNFYRLAVAPSHRRRGVGLALVAAGEERMRALGAPRVTALVAFDDADAGAFWDAAGYPRDEVVGRRVRTL
jgi:ribosomal protein S18 acetylase RimI-like enzyme